TRPLVVLGLLLLTVELFIGLVLFLALGETFFTRIASGELPPEQIFPVALQTAPFFFIVVLVLAMLVLMAYQFALPLVALNGVAPMEALKLSLLAGLHNWRALLVFSLIYLGLALLATLPMLLGWIVLAPVLLCATYAAYRDIFQSAHATPTETIIA
ncbi:MAG: BPSS1780 family membrane protein, partial [Gammaproteobacteria bacterium]